MSLSDWKCPSGSRNVSHKYDSKCSIIEMSLNFQTPEKALSWARRPLKVCNRNVLTLSSARNIFKPKCHLFWKCPNTTRNVSIVLGMSRSKCLSVHRNVSVVLEMSFSYSKWNSGTRNVPLVLEMSLWFSKRLS